LPLQGIIVIVSAGAEHKVTSRRS